MIPAGEGRPVARPMENAITAPWEKPPMTVRSHGIPASARRASSHEARIPLDSRKLFRMWKPDRGGEVPACPWRRPKWPTRRDAEKSLGRVQQVEEREQIVFVRPPPVNENERPGWGAVGGALTGDE